MRRSTVLLSLVAVCSSEKPPEVPVVLCPAEIVGPATGTPRRFVLDGLTLPRDNREFGDDLNGDRKIDVQLGNVTGSLATQEDGVSPEAIAAMLRTGTLAGVI